ncbi:hypothetical protein EYV94_24530 [Puteibacter caeruleilacunae]|nr:hypothetical protein EYV94_24530 [Puteibacter caeruleilacunae]
MEFDIWHYWFIAFILFLILEIFIPSFLMASIGIGCFFASVGGFFDAPSTVQLVLFIVGTLVGFLGIKPFMVNYAYKTEKEVRTNVHGMIGRTGKVCDTIDPDKDWGHVMIDGDTWQAISKYGVLIPRGTRVKVTAIDSIILTVELLAATEDEREEIVTPTTEMSSDITEETELNDTPVTEMSVVEDAPVARKMIMFSVGNKDKLIDAEEIMCFYSQQKITYLVMKTLRSYVIDDSLDKIEKKVSTDMFFRANRQFIISPECVHEIITAGNGKLKVRIHDHKQLPEYISVSRLKSHAFRKWIKEHCDTV